MIDHLAYQLACRVKALTLSVATTGSTSLSTTATGYARASGSFITDGFAPGMEMIGSGFNAANNAAHVITQVVTGFITTAVAPEVQAAAAGRTLTVGLPAARAWENVKLVPVPGVPYVEEQYSPGPEAQETLGAFGIMEADPMYHLYVHVPENTGISANGKYATAIKTLFAPRTSITLASGDSLTVRTQPGPFEGQRVPSSPGFSVKLVSIPLRARSTNSI